MARVTLKQDQSYINEIGQIKFGKKGATINVENSFLDLIKGKYELPEEAKAGGEELPQKPLKNMNKAELISAVKAADIEMSDEDLEKATKAELVAIIEEN